jgi:hypothetical protein
MPFPPRAPGKAGGMVKCGKNRLALVSSSDHFATEWASWVAPMEMMDLPELAGCPRRCLADCIVRKHIAHSTATIDEGQWSCLRLKEAYSEEEVVRRLINDPQLQWVFADPMRWPLIEPLTMRQLGRFNRPGVIACCERTVMGNPSRPADRRGKPPLFNLDQLTKIHAMELEDAMERADFATRALGIRDADIRSQLRIRFGI